jgi:hypothetical protein
MKVKIIQISGVILLLLTFLYVAFIKDTPNMDKSIWLSEITYMFICGGLMLFAPHIKSKSLFKP